jgi:queuine tRNA-ribosyltransferase
MQSREMFNFNVIATSTSGRARAGVIQTSRGEIETPVFMPVGTLGSVKSLSPEELRAAGARIILGNTYHLYLRPGCEVIERFSGLHGFMNWDRPILTDSGGFQVFSLAKLAKVSDDGVTFQSHIDGSSHILTPEKAIDIQICLDSDIIMCLDECIRYPAGHTDTHAAVVNTASWAKRCKQAWQQTANGHNALFGIVQGGMFKDLRGMSAEALVDIDFSGATARCKTQIYNGCGHPGKFNRACCPGRRYVRLCIAHAQRQKRPVVYPKRDFEYQQFAVQA